MVIPEADLPAVSEASRAVVRAAKDAVSYTHLDVYKRQLLALLGGLVGTSSKQRWQGFWKSFQDCLLYTSRCV